MARALILHNPAARNAPHPALLEAIASELRLAGFSGEVVGSRAPGDLTRRAREATQDGFDRVVICGGDGSVRDAAEGLSGSPVPLGVVPLGTANVLAREMGLPIESPLRCAALAGRGSPRPIGLGRVNGSVFTFCASAGIDALAVGRVDVLEKAQTGAWAYVHSALMALIESCTPEFTVVLEDGRRIRACQVFAARAHLYGGRFSLSSMASLESPTLRLLAIDPPLARHLTLVLAGLMGKGLEGVPGVTALDVRSFELESEGPWPVQADGDSIGQTPVSFRSEPRALTLVFPC
jgi:diacylglycerol kinase family enzyme